MRKNEADSSLSALCRAIDAYELTFRLKIEVLDNKVVRFSFLDIGGSVECVYDNQRVMG